MSPVSTDAATVEAELQALSSLKIDALRARWRARFGDAPPKLQSGDTLRRRLAERIQEQAYGRDLELEARLTQLVRGRARGEPLRAPKPTYKPGTRLTREHDGVVHHVEVLATGFRWDDREWRSLSEIARAITGVRWNGPRFFGLREDRTAPAKAPSGGRR